MTVVTAYYDDDYFTLALMADPAELRERYGRELREDGKYDLADDDLIRWVYDQNHDTPEIEVEE